MTASTGNVPVRDVQPGDWFVVDSGGRAGHWVIIGESVIERLRKRKRRWTHAGIAVKRVDGKLYSVEAGPSGAVLQEWPWGARPHLWSTGTRYSGGPQAARAALKYAGPGPWGDHGVRYSWLDYLAIALHAGGFDWQWLRRRIASTHEQICSQLVDQCCQEAGVQLFDDGRWPGYCDPDDLGFLLENDPAAAAKGAVA